MATSIFLGYPPENIKQFIIDNYSKPVDMTKVPLTFTAEEPNASIKMTSWDGPSITLETSIDNGNSWQEFIVDETEIILSNIGDSVMFRNSSDEIQKISQSDESANKFDLSGGKVAASGNIMFLMDKTGELKDLTNCTYAFVYLFQICKTLTHAPLFPATILDSSCYYLTFGQCSSLTDAPLLPAINLKPECYIEMFSGCTSLINAPKLIATSFDYGCYAGMFNGCTSLPEPKYDMSHMTFDQVTNAIQNVSIFNEYGTYEIQCSDKILVATYNNGEWIITEK